MPVDDAMLDALEEAVPLLELEPDEYVTSRRMFGGVCYMLNGKMFAGTGKQQLMIRLEEAEFTEASAKGQVTVMDFTGRPLSGFAYVVPEAFATQEALLGWLEMSLRYVRKHMVRQRPRRSGKRG
jgi:TfoX/Sxy family transcriptional regulator of competence genes